MTRATEETAATCATEETTATGAIQETCYMDARVPVPQDKRDAFEAEDAMLLYPGSPHVDSMDWGAPDGAMCKGYRKKIHKWLCYFEKCGVEQRVQRKRRKAGLEDEPESTNEGGKD